MSTAFGSVSGLNAVIFIWLVEEDILFHTQQDYL